MDVTQTNPSFYIFVSKTIQRHRVSNKSAAEEKHFLTLRRIERTGANSRVKEKVTLTFIMYRSYLYSVHFIVSVARGVRLCDECSSGK